MKEKSRIDYGDAGLYDAWMRCKDKDDSAMLITNCGDFCDDDEKMEDLNKMSKSEFLRAYSYLRDRGHAATLKAVHEYPKRKHRAPCSPQNNVNE